MDRKYDPVLVQVRRVGMPGLAGMGWIISWLIHMVFVEFILNWKSEFQVGWVEAPIDDGLGVVLISGLTDG